jgi:poly-gamma-glutamate capsule biosynthesis protein CapA/YwtB (metallophosphatase superfamily)
LRRTLNNKMKRQQAKRQTAFLIIGCFALAALVASVYGLTPSNPPIKNEVEVKSAAFQNPVQTEDVTATSTQEDAEPLSLGIGGDVCFGLDVADLIATEGPAYPWSEITPLLKSYDLTAVNLEGPLCRGGESNPNQPSFKVKGDIACAAPMAEAGVSAVCLANDHIMDYGSQGLEETLNILHGQDLKACGAGSSKKAAQEALVMDTDNGARIALLNFCDVAQPSYTAGDDSPGLSAADTARIGELVEQAKQEAPYVVVIFHWGAMGSSGITSRQRELAHASIQAGADLVVGSHPHLVQGLELYEGVPIIYSLGNLVFSAQSEEGKNGIFAGCAFDGGRLTSLEIVPLQVNRGQPVPLSGDQAEHLLRDLAASSPGVDLFISPQTATATLNL